jgi:hypothetical protein
MRNCCRGPGSYYNVPEVEGPKGLHKEEASRELLSLEIVGEVQDPTTPYLRKRALRVSMMKKLAGRRFLERLL